LGLFGGLCGALMVAATPARALDEPGAVAFVNDLVRDAFKSLSPKELSPDQRRQIIRDLVNRYADIGQVSEGLIGRFWARATPEDQAKFQGLFVDYMLSGLAGDMLTDIGAAYQNPRRPANRRAHYRAIYLSGHRRRPVVRGLGHRSRP
jgi:ABC-type transporter MlaC component